MDVITYMIVSKLIITWAPQYAISKENFQRIPYSIAVLITCAHTNNHVFMCQILGVNMKSILVHVHDLPSI